MTRRKILLPFLVLALAGLGSFLLIVTAPEVESVSPEQVVPIVRAIDARPGDIRMRVRSQGTVAPRTDDDAITLFKSVGHALEDLVAAAALYEAGTD